MKSAVRFLFFLGLLCLMLPDSLWADTIYTYTGNRYNACYGVFYCNLSANSSVLAGTSPLSMSITLDVPLAGDELDNLPIFTPVPVSSFSISDGTGLYITQANAVDVTEPIILEIATGPTGAIIGWNIWVQAYELYPPPLGYVEFSSQFVNDAYTAVDASTVNVFNPGSLIAAPFVDEVGLAYRRNGGVWSSSSTPILESSVSTPIPEPSAATPIPEPSTLLLLGALGILVLWQNETVRWWRTISGRRGSHRWLSRSRRNHVRV